MAVNQVLYKKMSYDPDKDFTPVYFYVKSPFVLVVNPALPINSVPELIKYAKESANAAELQHAGRRRLAAPVDGVHGAALRPQGHACALSAARRNPSPTSPPVTSISASPKPAHRLPLIREGKLRALAVSSLVRLPTLPDVPPFGEAAGAPDFEAVSWHILFAPAATPNEIVERLHRRHAAHHVGARHEETRRGYRPAPAHSPPIDGIRTYVKSEQEKWGSLVKKLGLDGTQ